MSAAASCTGEALTLLESTDVRMAMRKARCGRWPAQLPKLAGRPLAIHVLVQPHSLYQRQPVNLKRYLS